MSQHEMHARDETTPAECRTPVGVQVATADDRRAPETGPSDPAQAHPFRFVDGERLSSSAKRVKTDSSGRVASRDKLVLLLEQTEQVEDEQDELERFHAELGADGGSVAKIQLKIEDTLEQTQNAEGQRELAALQERVHARRKSRSQADALMPAPQQLGPLLRVHTTFPRPQAITHTEDSKDDAEEDTNEEDVPLSFYQDTE
ncbi:hypothetical protein FVE85_0697 [Porphyridium purpureum]|uniref:Uncharacterized protein n=1 Tax=Porphyridium purpureum TaxID=35688 RepID=A0A5J4Z0W3_PORPP|nr:hypothetical protein FVE85_0697 [Porphyridium purpureum]|eukprot:POR0714..scf208_2